MPNYPWDKKRKKGRKRPFPKMRAPTEKDLDIARLITGQLIIIGQPDQTNLEIRDEGDQQTITLGAYGPSAGEASVSIVASYEHSVSGGFAEVQISAEDVNDPTFYAPYIYMLRDINANERYVQIGPKVVMPGSIYMEYLPTSDPGTNGRLWQDSNGFVKVS